MVDFTIICIWYKEKIYQDLLSSLKEQVDVNYKLLSVDNSNGVMKSIREVFNGLFDQIEGRYAFFIHPDIRFLDKNTLRDILNTVQEINEFGVIGTAGCKREKKWEILSNMNHGIPCVNCGTRIERPIKVQTLDECFFIIKTDYLKEHPFSELDGWHLYAVEKCIEANRLGMNNYVIPASIHHLSNGRSLDPSYMDTLDKLIRDNRGVGIINTTVKQWKTKGIGAVLYRKYYYAKQCLKKMIRG